MGRISTLLLYRLIRMGIILLFLTIFVLDLQAIIRGSYRFPMFKRFFLFFSSFHFWNSSNSFLSSSVIVVNILKFQHHPPPQIMG